MNTHHRINTSSRRSITQMTRIKIYEFLKPLLVRRDDGLWEYNDDWTDVAVASQFQVGESTVAKIREAGFGKLRRITNTVMRPDPELTARVERLEQEAISRIESLERRVLSMLSSIESHGRVAMMFERRLDEAARENAITRSELDRVLTKLASLLED